MAFERIELNICPAGDMPVFHCSQYDTGRPIIIDLLNGDDAFTPSSGTTFELHCRKVDDNIVTLDTYEVDGNTLTFTSTEQLCACPGDNLCEVAIYLDELCMGTLNFMLHVEPDPLAGGLESETQIYNLTEQVEEITEQVIGDNYYDKTEVDDLLDTKADAATTYTKTEVDTALNLKADRSTTYTKTETNNLLAGKADANDTYSKAQVDSKLSLKADKATTYTKTETDTLLSYKANASQVYTMSQTDLLLADKADKSTTYTKTQVDNALALKANSADLATVATTGDYDDLLNKPTIPAAQVQSDYAQSDNTQVDYIKNKPDIDAMIAAALLEVMPVDTATGAIASFNTELAAPLVNVSCEIVATGGNGTPDNPNPIVGYSSANITRCGVNLFDKTATDTTNGYIANSYIRNNNAIISDTDCDVSEYIRMGGGLTITLNPLQFSNPSICFYDSSKNFISGEAYNSRSVVTVTTPNNCAYVRFSIIKANIDTIQLELGSYATSYHAYNGQTYTIAFGQTVYGGVLDVTRGKFTVTHSLFDGATFISPQNNNDGDGTVCFILASTAGYKAPKDYCLTNMLELSNQNWNALPKNSVSISNATYIVVCSDTPNQTLEQFKTWFSNNVQLLLQLATPFDIDLTPVQIRALVGENNVYSDTNGNTTVKFKDSIQHYIDTKVGS